MNVLKRITAISLLLVIVSLGFTSCGSSVSQEDYDNLMNQLNSAKEQLAELQESVTDGMDPSELASKYEELQQQLNTRMDELESLQSKFDDLQAEYDQFMEEDRAGIIQAKYDDLLAEFDELQAKYDITVSGTAEFDPEEIDQAIFELVNQERRENDVDELIWGVNLYKVARQNSRDMAESGDYQLSASGAVWQEVFIGSRYGTIDQIAEGAMTIWKNNDYNYRYNIINPQPIYGAVSTHRQGDVYYITYVASVFK